MSRRHVNRVILIGEVAQDPESGTLGDGTPIVTFVLATGDDRHRVRVLDERLAKVARYYVRRGALLYLCGAVHVGAGGGAEIVVPPYRGELQMLDRRDRDT